VSDDYSAPANDTFPVPVLIAGGGGPPFVQPIIDLSVRKCHGCGERKKYPEAFMVRERESSGGTHVNKYLCAECSAVKPVRRLRRL
jgi:hypothetical protein